jgi:hypothetical protein
MRAGAVHEREFAQVEHHPPRTATANRAACAPAAESSPGPGRRLPAPRSRPDQRSYVSRRRPAARYPRGGRSNQRAARSTSRPPGLVDPRKSGRARPPLWADLTMDALQPPRYSARQTDQRHCSAAEQPPALGDPAVVDEIGQRKDEHPSHDVSGCCWLPLMQPITRQRSHVRAPPGSARASPPETPSAAGTRTNRGRPPTTSAPRARSPAQQTRHHVLLVVGLRAGRPAAVELLQQTHHPVRDRRQHITVRRRRAPGRLTGSQQDRVCPRSEDHPIANVSAHANGEKYLARWGLACRLAREPCAMDKGDDLAPPAPDTPA